jgi:hypothetical protein
VLQENLDCIVALWLVSIGLIFLGGVTRNGVSVFSFDVKG